jgi:hypothetical protein
VILQLTHDVTGSPEMALFLPALFGSVGIAIILITMSRLSGNCLSLATLIGLILLMPEFLFSSIYMNSTVFGLPFAALAVWLACSTDTAASESKRDLSKSFLVGFSIALAALCRFDYILAFPMFLLLAARGPGRVRWRRVLACGLGCAVAFLPACAIGLTGPTPLLAGLTRHQAALGSTGRFHRPFAERLAQAIVGVNPIVWGIAAATATTLLVRTIRRRRWTALLAIGPAAVLLYPILCATTPKYLLPFDMFLAVFLAWSLSETVPARILSHSLSGWALAAAVMLACFLPARLTSRPPFVRPTMNTAITTDDGPRAFFGYAYALRYQSKRLEPPNWLEDTLAERKDLLLVAPFDGWLAGSLSQRILIHLARNCRDAAIGAGVFSGRFAGRKIVLAEPARVPESLAAHFPPGQTKPLRVDVPHGFTPSEVRVIRALTAGDKTIPQLEQETQLDADTLATALLRLRWAHVLETTQQGGYRISFDIPLSEPDATR